MAKKMARSIEIKTKKHTSEIAGNRIKMATIDINFTNNLIFSLSLYFFKLKCCSNKVKRRINKIANCFSITYTILHKISRAAAIEMGAEKKTSFIENDRYNSFIHPTINVFILFEISRTLCSPCVLVRHTHPSNQPNVGWNELAQTHAHTGFFLSLN